MNGADPTANEQTEENHSQEWRQLVFDYYKQLATLSGAAIVVVLAIYREDILELNSIQFALANFGLSVYTAVTGMRRMVVWFPYVRTGIRPDAPFLAELSVNFLSIGVASVMVSALDLPPRAIYVVVAVGLGSVLWLLWLVLGKQLLAKVRRPRN